MSAAELGKSALEIESLKEGAENLHEILDEGFKVVETYFVDPQLGGGYKREIQKGWYPIYEQLKQLLNHQYEMLRGESIGLDIFQFRLSSETERNFYWNFLNYQNWHNPDEPIPKIEIQTPKTAFSIQGQKVEGIATAGGYDVGMWRDVAYTITSITPSRTIEAVVFSNSSLEKITFEEGTGKFPMGAVSPYRKTITINLGLL